MTDHLGRAGSASNRNEGPVFRAIVEDKFGGRQTIMVLGFSGERGAFVMQLAASEHARTVAVNGVSFRGPK